MQQIYSVSVCLIFILLVVGCIGGEPRTDYPPEISLDGPMNASDDEFHLGGVIQEQGGTAYQNTYHDIVVCLYAEDGEKLHTTTPVEINPSQRRVNISVTTDVVPKYVIVNSPDFWKHPDVQVTYYFKTTFQGETAYQAERIGQHKSLPKQNCSA